MLRWLAIPCVVLLTLSVGSLCLASRNSWAEPHGARYVVTLRASQADVAATAQQVAAQYRLTLRHIYRHALAGFSADVPPAQLGKLRSDSRVASVARSETGELAGAAALQPPAAARPTGQIIPPGVRRLGADRSPIAAIDGIDTLLPVDVAVIDSGIEPNHPDLNLAGSFVCSQGRADEQLPSEDLTGHGTAVAGVIAARDNTLGVVGVAPGARLWSLRVAHRTADNRVRYATDDLICALDWLTAHAGIIEVANISLGSYAALGLEHGPCGRLGQTVEAALHRAICAATRAGVTVVVAAGEPRTTLPRVDAAFIAPASFEEVIAVSAMADFDGQPGGMARQAPCLTDDRDDTFWNESNYGASVDFTAPGVCIMTTSDTPWTGTSFAAPHVAGAAALYKAIHPAATPAEVKRALQIVAQHGWNASATGRRPAGDDPDAIAEPLINVRRLVLQPPSTRVKHVQASAADALAATPRP